jgi:hypothetical protein
MIDTHLKHWDYLSTIKRKYHELVLLRYVNIKSVGEEEFNLKTKKVYARHDRVFTDFMQIILDFRINVKFINGFYLYNHTLE